MSRAPIGLLFNGVWSQYALASAPKYQSHYELLYVHELRAGHLEDRVALVIPFQSHQEAIFRHKDLLYEFLAEGKKIVVFGDSTPKWIDAQWEDRPVDNYWWVADPNNPPIARTDDSHPVFSGLKPRHSCWHVHGVYTRIPSEARVLQSNPQREVITWETNQYGGTLFASTLDPIVEHGIQQIRHLDNFVDSLTNWLTGSQPTGKFTVPSENYCTNRALELTGSLTESGMPYSTSG
jgi:hypothetical protein